MSTTQLPPPKLLLSMDELGQVLGLRKTALYAALKRRELAIPVIKVGRTPRVRVVDVEQYLEMLADDARDHQIHKQTPATKMASQAGVAASSRQVGRGSRRA